MNLLKLFNDNLAVLSGIILSVTAIAGVFPRGRAWLIQALKFVCTPLTAPWGVRKLAKDFHLMQASISEVRKEVSETGDGSIRREMARLDLGQSRLEEHRRYMFRIQNRPALEMDSEGNVVLVSQEACRLFNLTNDRDLRGLSYQQFLEGPQVEEFNVAFLRMARANSSFRFALSLIDSNSTPMGVWEWRAEPIGPKINGCVHYTCQLVPMGDTALTIARSHGWKV